MKTSFHNDNKEQSSCNVSQYDASSRPTVESPNHTVNNHVVFEMFSHSDDKVKNSSDVYPCDTSSKVLFESTSHSDDKVKSNGDGYLCDTSRDVSFEGMFHSDGKIKDSSDGYLCEVSNQPTLESFNHTPDSQSTKCRESKIRIAKNPPPLDKDTWKKYDKEFSESNSIPWAKVRNGELEAEKYVEELNTDLANFLLSKEEFQFEVKGYFKHKPPKSNEIEDMKQKKKN